jgi:hypothetical protein
MWSWAPDGYLIPRQTGRLTVRSTITLTLKQVSLLLDLFENRQLTVIWKTGSYQRGPEQSNLRTEEFTALRAIIRKLVVKT